MSLRIFVVLSCATVSARLASDVSARGRPVTAAICRGRGKRKCSPAGIFAGKGVVPLLLATGKVQDFGTSRGVVSPTRRIRREPPLAFAFRKELPLSQWSIEELAEESRRKPYLLVFFGRGDDYSKKMLALKNRIKDEYGIEMRVFEVFVRRENLKLLFDIDRDRCGGVPYFFNKKTRRYICGPTTYENLVKLALCERNEPWTEQPVNRTEQAEKRRMKALDMFETAKDTAQDAIEAAKSQAGAQKARTR